MLVQYAAHACYDQEEMLTQLAANPHFISTINCVVFLPHFEASPPKNENEKLMSLCNRNTKDVVWNGIPSIKVAIFVPW